MQTRRFRRQLIAAAIVAPVVVAAVAAFALADANVSAPSSAPPVRQVPARIAAQFPVLSNPLSPSEAQQLPTVSRVMSRLAALDEPATLDGVNTELARRISQDQDSAEWVVPGNETVCMVAITAGHSTGAGCAAASSVEMTGTTSLTVVPGGYQLSGILPSGTSDISITDMSKQTTVVAANPNHAFEFFSATPLEKLSYALPGGGTHEGSLELPPPRDAPPPAN